MAVHTWKEVREQEQSWRQEAGGWTTSSFSQAIKAAEKNIAVVISPTNTL